MDWELAKTATFRVLEIRFDDIDEIGKIRALEPGEKSTNLDRFERNLCSHRFLQSGVAEVGEVVRGAESPTLKNLPRDARLLKSRRQIRFLVPRLLLMSELQVESIRQEL